MQVLVLLVPVLIGLIGFAFDLGEMYLVRGELQSAANSMALAAAQKLIGSDLASDTATAYARQTLETDTGFGNKYFFGGYTIGQVNGTLSSDAPDPVYYQTAADAIAGNTAGGVAGSAARHARVTLNAEAPVTFWSFLPLATSRKVPIQVAAVAGISAPLCTACDIEPIAVAAIDPTDAVDFGFTLATEYTLGYVCNGAPTPVALPNTAVRVPYLLLNRLDPNAIVFADEQSQLYRDGAGGLPGTTTATQSCFTVNNTELMWVNAAPVPCVAGNPGTYVTAWMCGLTARFESTYPASCASIAEIDTISSIFAQDTDTTEITDYTQYQGNGRRVITVVVVDALSTTGAMTVLGFRQFVVEPVSGGIDVNVTDANGRFGALYIGSPVPVKQGALSGCVQSAGPGKVILHQ